MTEEKAFNGARGVIHTPAEIGKSYLGWAESRKEGRGIPFGMKDIDEHVIPFQPGELISFVARPGHLKTGMLAKLARDEAQRIIERGKEDEQCVVFVTWEESAEELNALFEANREYTSTDLARGRVDLDIIRRQAVKRAGLPIWIIGHGISRAGAASIRLTPDVVLSAVEAMEEDFGVKPTMMLFDYLQLIPSSNHRDRVQQVTEMPIRIKELALRIGIPAVCAVQAARRVDDYADKMPRMRDAQWASSIEQTSDKIFGLQYPVQYYDRNELIEVTGYGEMPITENLLIMKMLKQRFAAGAHTWALSFDPATLRMGTVDKSVIREPQRSEDIPF